MIPFQGFVGPAYRSQSPIADAQRCINIYPQIIENAGAKARYALYPTPGLQQFATATEAPFRALFTEHGRVFGIVAHKLYEYLSDGTKSDRGSVDNDGLPAQITSNGDIGGQLFIASGDKGYCYNLSTNVLTNPLTSGCDYVGFVDGYFISLNVDTSTFRISAVGDGTSWDNTQIAQRTLGPDPWVAMYVVDAEIWLVGTKTTEIWYNAGRFPFPFAPRLDAFMQEGCLAGRSIAEAGGGLVWLQQNARGARSVISAAGYQPRRVSNEGVEYAISRYTTVTDAVAFSYEDQGRTFYVLTFPTEQQTWVLDVGGGLWHERAFWHGQTATWKAYRPMYHCYAFGKHLVGDRETGTLYQMDIAVYTDAGGAALRRLRTSPHVHSGRQIITYDRFELDMQVGVGLTGVEGVVLDSPQSPTAGGAVTTGVNPQVMMRISKDGGHTWSTERMCAAGKIGNYLQRVFWTRCGDARDAVFEVSFSDPVPFRIVDAYLDLRVGTH